MRFRSLVLVVVGSTVLAGVASAQAGPEPRALALGGAYAALAQGHEALFWNPANLGLPGSPDFSIGLPSLAVLGGMTESGYADLGPLLDDSMDATERSEFLAAFPNGAETGFGLIVPVLGVSWRGFAVDLRRTYVGTGRLDAGVLSLLADVRTFDEVPQDSLGNYSVGETGYHLTGYTTATAGYGRGFRIGGIPISAGASLSYWFSGSEERGKLFDPTLVDAGDDLVLPLVAARRGNGSGLGLNVGLAARPVPQLTLSASMQNAAWSLNWDEEIGVRGGNFSIDEIDDFDDVRDQLSTVEPFDSSSASLEQYIVASGVRDAPHPPPVVRLGAAYDLDRVTVAAGYTKVVEDAEMYAGWPSMLSVGGEFRIGFAAIRLGAATSSESASLLSGGLGFHLLGMDIDAALAKVSGSGEVETPFDPITGESEPLPDRLASGSGVSASLRISIFSF